MIDDIKKAIKHAEKRGFQSAMIEHKFNKLFYLKPNIEGELEFLSLLLNREGKSQDRVGLHASAIITSENQFCYREQVLSLFYQQLQDENVRAGLKRIYEEGNFIHQKWQRLFIRGGLCLPKHCDHTNFIDKYDLSYTPDIKIKLDDQRYIVEVKSMNTWQYKKANGNHPSGEKQCNFYLALDKIKTGIERKGLVLIEDKNDQNFSVKIIEHDKEKSAPYIQRLEDVHEMKQEFLDDHVVPKRKCKDCDCKRAQECNMRDACWNIGMGRIKLKERKD